MVENEKTNKIVIPLIIGVVFISGVAVLGYYIGKGSRSVFKPTKSEFEKLSFKTDSREPSVQYIYDKKGKLVAVRDKGQVYVFEESKSLEEIIKQDVKDEKEIRLLKDYDTIINFIEETESSRRNHKSSQKTQRKPFAQATSPAHNLWKNRQQPSRKKTKIHLGVR